MQVVTDTDASEDGAIPALVSRFLRHYRADLNGGLLLAVSGGSDSLALLQAFADLPAEERPPLKVATVDHALRPEAADEARRVGEMCASLCLEHSILTLEWEDASHVSQADARRARYAALAEHARQNGLGAIATGHTLDDQLETVFIRLGAGSGEYGLAGMADIAPLPVWPDGYDVRLVRPLLSTTRQALRHYLQARAAHWIDDPSNENLKFERVRVRRTFEERPALRAQMAKIALVSSARRTQQAERLLGWARSSCAFHLGGAVSFDVTSFLQLDADDRFRCLGALLTSGGGREALPRRDKLLALIDLSGCDAGRTLHGCRLQVKDGRCLIVQEAEAASGVETILPGETVVWKGRTELTSHEDTKRSVFIASWEERPVPAFLPRDALPDYTIRRSLPVVLGEDGGVWQVPHLQESASVCPRDLAEERFYNLLQFKAQFFANESRLRESFS